jgi:hypothetical protein
VTGGFLDWLGVLLSHSLHAALTTSTYSFIPGHQNEAMPRASMLVTPWCSACRVASTSFRSRRGTTTRSPYILTPSDEVSFSFYLVKLDSSTGHMDGCSGIALTSIW